MRHIKSLKLFMAVAVVALSHSASAVRVTNLDTLPHMIIYEAAGHITNVAIPVGETVHIMGAPNGILSLKTSSPKAAKSTLQADGLLSGIVGVGRNQNIPASNEDDFVIWPGEQLMLQHRRRDQGNR